MTYLDVLKRKEFAELRLKAFERVRQLYSKLSELVLYNGVSEKQWATLVKDLEKKRLSRIKFIIEFLEELEKGIWAEMYDVWNQPNMTPEMWHNYKLLFDKPKLIEQRQMKQLERRLKDRWAKWKDELRDRIVAEKEGRVLDNSFDVKPTEQELMNESKALSDDTSD